MGSEGFFNKEENKEDIKGEDSINVWFCAELDGAGGEYTIDGSYRCIVVKDQLCAGKSEERIIDKRFEASCNTISKSISSRIRTLNTTTFEIRDIQTEVRYIVSFVDDKREKYLAKARYIYRYVLC